MDKADDLGHSSKQFYKAAKKQESSGFFGKIASFFNFSKKEEAKTPMEHPHPSSETGHRIYINKL